MKTIAKLASLAMFTMLFTAALAHAQLGTSTVTTNLNLTVAPEAALTIQTANTNLTAPGNNFSNYTGTTNFTYFVRTTKSGGSGFVTLQITSDFGPTGGPSVASPPTSADKLNYACTIPAASSGSVTACSPLAASTTSATNVASFGADTRTTTAGVSSSVLWSLVNDPLYQTGSYTAIATFTISAT